MSTTTASAVMALASDVWASVSTEVTIFLVTLTVAMAMHSIQKRSIVGKKLPAKKMVDGGCTPTKANCNLPEGSQLHRRTTPGHAAQSPHNAGHHLPQQQQRPCAAGHHLAGSMTATQIIDEVVNGVAENRSMKAASRALGLFGRLQQTLAAPGAPSMAKAAQGSRHQPLDFYTTVLQCAVRVGRFDMLDEIMDAMVTHGVARSLAFYELAMKQLAAQKQHAAALKVYDRLAADGLQPSAVSYSCLIGFAAEVGELGRAAEFFEKLSAVTTPSIRAYMTMLRVHAKRQDWPASLALLREMRSRGVRPDSLVLNFVLATGIAADQVDAVSALLEEMDAEKHQISDVVSYNTLIKGYAQRGDVESASKVTQRMLKRGLTPNSITFNTTMDAAVRGSCISKAWEVLAAMRAARMRPDKFTCSILVKGLLRGVAPTRPEHIQASLELLGEVGTSCDATLLSSLYNGVLEAAGQSRHQELVAKTLAQMKRSRVVPRPEALAAVSGGR